MAYQVLARKYRPQRFSDVIGQDHVTRTLKNAIEQQRIAHGYIFSGHRGIGKTTIARILAMALNCLGPDGKADRPQPEPCGVCRSCLAISSASRSSSDTQTFEETHSLNYEEIDAATNRGIDEARRIIGKITNGSPAGGERYRIIVLDEAHQITDAAFNSMLKTLEEPPPWAVFMMATTQPEDIPQTIRSRCQHFSFHAVKFDDIVKQLGDIARQENIRADQEALAVLAEAGDGSMRDALSIMDQAIACCGTTITAEGVRGLVGTVGSDVLEEIMGTVARNSSEEALRLLDRLMTEGQNPAFFARQLVRFLRNVLVAKVATSNSELLQVSSDERARAARVAEQFSEEDLARFLQIMLRTYDEIGYRQEQRFHLELGILKLVHAQRILPLEQVLSQVTAETPRAAAPRQPAIAPATPAAASVPRRNETIGSPFEADRARKSRSFDPEMSSRPVAESVIQAAPVAVAVALEEPPPESSRNGAPQMESQREPVPQPSGDPNVIFGAVLSELENAGHKMLASTLEAGSIELRETELIISIPRSAAVIDLMMGPEPKRIANAAAGKAAGRALKVNVVAGSAGQRNGNGNGAQAARPVRNGAGARSRAAEDPIVRRMQEKFGAEIRTVIDQRDKD